MKRNTLALTGILAAAALFALPGTASAQYFGPGYFGPGFRPNYRTNVTPTFPAVPFAGYGNFSPNYLGNNAPGYNFNNGAAYNYNSDYNYGSSFNYNYQDAPTYLGTSYIAPAGLSPGFATSPAYQTRYYAPGASYSYGSNYYRRGGYNIFRY